MIEFLGWCVLIGLILPSAISLTIGIVGGIWIRLFPKPPTTKEWAANVIAEATAKPQDTGAAYMKARIAAEPKPGNPVFRAAMRKKYGMMKK